MFAYAFFAHMAQTNANPSNAVYVARICLQFTTITGKTDAYVLINLFFFCDSTVFDLNAFEQDKPLTTFNSVLKIEMLFVDMRFF